MTTIKAKRENLFMRIARFYIDGFRNMKLGKTLWAIILIKLFIMFAILKVFFFPNFLKENAKAGKEGEFIEQQLMKR